MVLKHQFSLSELIYFAFLRVDPGSFSSFSVLPQICPRLVGQIFCPSFRYVSHSQI